jgi:hypothetical protein
LSRYRVGGSSVNTKLVGGSSVNSKSFSGNWVISIVFGDNSVICRNIYLKLLDRASKEGWSYSYI